MTVLSFGALQSGTSPTGPFCTEWQKGPDGWRNPNLANHHHRLFGDAGWHVLTANGRPAAL